ncbi:hypothetical protein [Stenotrophomonas maltophilia]|uniref:hypothetical protein n=1 Tax=Stenotrophomonas maltophilia TaxID=40324 RepID=UPI001E583DD2|nr:hypothetical protein [Stenotrophomonas maltophilia]
MPAWPSSGVLRWTIVTLLTGDTPAWIAAASSTPTRSLTGGLDLARSVHYLALSARLIEQAPAASEQDKLEPWLHPHA